MIEYFGRGREFVYLAGRHITLTAVSRPLLGARQALPKPAPRFPPPRRYRILGLSNLCNSASALTRPFASTLLPSRSLLNAALALSARRTPRTRRRRRQPFPPFLPPDFPTRFGGACPRFRRLDRKYRSWPHLLVRMQAGRQGVAVQPALRKRGAVGDKAVQ